MIYSRVCLLSAMAAFGLTGAAGAACRIQVVAELPVTLTSQKPLVQARINGHDAAMIVDSGATGSGMTAESAAKLGVPSSTPRGGLQVRTFGAEAPLAVGAIKDFELAGAVYHDVQVLVGGAIAQVGAAGRIGQNVLGGEDAEYDLGGGAVRILRPQGCEGGALAYWAKDKPPATVPIEHLATARQIRGTVAVNGVKVQALFDTGSPFTYLDPKVAERAGVDLTSPAVRHGPGVRGVAGGAGLPVLITTVRDIDVGGAHIAGATLRVVELAAPSAPMLIGLDFFMTHRVVVDSAHDRLYVTDSAPGRSAAP